MRPLLVAGCLALILGCYDTRHQGMVDVSGPGDVLDAVVEPTKHEFSTSCIATLPGTITRSPALAIDGDVVVLLDADADQGPRLAKLSLDGELRWLLTLGEPGDVAASPPVVRQSGEILVTISGPDAGFLLRVDPATGTRLGTIPLGEGPHFAPAPLPPGPILITSGKTLRAFSREGVELWVRQYSEPVSSSVVVGSSNRVAEIAPDPAGGGIVSYRVLDKGYQRLAAFGLENGELVWLELADDPLAVVQEKTISLQPPQPVNPKLRFVARQPGAFNRANVLVVTAVDRSVLAVSPSGDLVWGLWLAKDWFGNQYEGQLSAPVFQGEELPRWLDGARIELNGVDRLYAQLYPFNPNSDQAVAWSVWALEKRFPLWSPPAPICFGEGETLALNERDVVWLTGLSFEDNSSFGDLNLNLPVRSSAILVETRQLLVTGGDGGCVLGISFSASPERSELSSDWPRFRYDNRNSGVRWGKWRD